ncbi:MAG TPA: HDOD domain-containing protein [Planctomycetaceae bacterium]|jgi:HD-like signal output (HDOD) protein/DNA-binding response OmpR family regulator|nr:HDOD domain-containing protein [Planctomycetaceae bacterium]
MAKRRLKALVVDDDTNVRSLLIGWLFREGFLCNEADDGAKALREMQHADYDLVVTDLRMPNRHGHSLCQAILAQNERPRLVVVTGVTDPRIFRDLQSRGVDHIFQKPLDAPEFLGRIREIALSCTTAAPAVAQQDPASSPADEEDLPLSPNPSQESDLREAETNEVDPGERPGQRVVAVFLRDAHRAQALAAQLRQESLFPFVPESTDALCRMAERHHLELLVLENSRFGFLNAQDLVGHLKSLTPLTEVILLSDDNASPGEVAGWASTPKLLSRNATITELLLTVRGKIGAMNQARGGVSSEARKLVRPFATLSNSQKSLLKLAAFLRTPTPELSVDRVATAVLADAETTAETLRLAKAASAGVRGPITNVADAINRIGALRTVALLVTAGIKSAEKPLLRQISAPLRAWYARRSALNATLASLIARQDRNLSGDVAFVLGLLQDIGIAGLAAAFEDRYVRLIARAKSCGPAQLHVIEHEDLRVEHSEISAALMEQWCLPDELLSVVRFHHSPKPPGGEGRESLRFIDSMRVAEGVADLCDNRHPTRRREFLRRLGACCNGRPEPSLQMLHESAHLPSETAQQFRVPFTDEALLRGIFRDLLDSCPAAST